MKDTRTCIVCHCTRDAPCVLVDDIDNIDGGYTTCHWVTPRFTRGPLCSNCDETDLDI